MAESSPTSPSRKRPADPDHDDGKRARTARPPGNGAHNIVVRVESDLYVVDILTTDKHSRPIIMTVKFDRTGAMVDVSTLPPLPGLPATDVAYPSYLPRGPSGSPVAAVSDDLNGKVVFLEPLPAVARMFVDRGIIDVMPGDGCAWSVSLVKMLTVLLPEQSVTYAHARICNGFLVVTVSMESLVSLVAIDLETAECITGFQGHQITRMPTGQTLTAKKIGGELQVFL